jgi:hypothetical protein
MKDVLLMVCALKFALLLGATACSSNGLTSSSGPVNASADGGHDAAALLAVTPAELESLFDYPATEATRFDVVEGLWTGSVDGANFDLRARLRDGILVVAGKCDGRSAFGFAVPYVASKRGATVSRLTAVLPAKAKDGDCTLQLFAVAVEDPLSDGRLHLPVSYGLAGEYVPYDTRQATIIVMEMPSGRTETEGPTGTAIPSLYKIGE